MMYKLNIKRSPVLNTKWGRAKINHNHYQITTRKEENGGKLLHRLIWEEYYGKNIPEGYVIHHKDENPLNNCISNLELMTFPKHVSLHMSGENNPWYGKTGENHPTYGTIGEKNPNYKHIPLVRKGGFINNKQRYQIWFNMKLIYSSIIKYRIDNYYRAIMFNFKYKYIDKEE